VKKRYILVCEKGWHGLRQLSLDLSSKGIPAIVLIKGSVERDVQGMITAHRGINNVFIPEMFFTPVVFISIMFNIILSLRRRLVICLSKDKTYKRLEIFKKIFSGIELIKVYDRNGA